MTFLSRLRSIDVWTSLVCLTAVGVVLFLRFQLGIVRYFDVDEFAHLHWAYNFFAGYHPYRDYLYFFPPGFLFLLWPLFAVMGETYAILTVARVFAFGWFVLLLVVLFLLVKQLRGSSTAILSVVILAWLPLPADKFLEIRPDTPAVAVSFLGMYFLVKMLNGANVPMFQKKKWVFQSGLCYGLGMMILPKVALFFIAALAIFGLRENSDPGSVQRSWLFFGLGVFFPLAGTLFFFLWSGDFARAMYLTTIFASESTKVLGSKFYMFASHFFYPNDVYYGLGGISSVLISNHLVYIVGLLGGVFSMASVLCTASRKKHLPALLVTASFLINLYAFMRIVPLKHAQYLILLAPFVAFYTATAIMNVVSRFSIVGLLLLLILLCIGIYTSWQMYRVKRTWTNASTFADVEIVARTIPEDEYVWDLFGQTIFYKDPYYICCLPYGQYMEAFGFVPPSLPEALENTNTKYIFAHHISRLSVLSPQDAAHISKHYEPIIDQPLIFKRK